MNPHSNSGLAIVFSSSNHYRHVRDLRLWPLLSRIFFLFYNRILWKKMGGCTLEIVSLLSIPSVVFDIRHHRLQSCVGVLNCIENKAYS